MRNVKGRTHDIYRIIGSVQSHQSGPEKMNKCLNACIRISRTIPLIFILLIIGWSYYAYIVGMCIYAIPVANVGEKVAYIFFYHLVFAMFIWAYIQTAIATPSVIPPEFKLAQADFANIEPLPGDPEALARRREFLNELLRQRRLPVLTRGGSDGGAVRICDTCRLIKPDRAHHCSTCGLCLLKMDHHCPWVNNCVGYHNYKYFLLFLLYGSLYCCYVGATSAKYCVAFWTEGVSDIQAYRFHVLFVFFVAWLFSLSLFFLGGYHAFLTLRNRTTIESSRAPVFASGGSDMRAYDVGPGRNFRQVFGDRWHLWALPVMSWCTDGVHWEQRTAPAGDRLPPVSVSPILLLASRDHRRGSLDLEAARS